MADLGNFTANELSDVTGISVLAAMNYLDQCEREGLLQKQGDYRYQLASEDAKLRNKEQQMSDKNAPVTEWHLNLAWELRNLKVPRHLHPDDVAGQWLANFEHRAKIEKAVELFREWGFVESILSKAGVGCFSLHDEGTCKHCDAWRMLRKFRADCEQGLADFKAKPDWQQRVIDEAAELKARLQRLCDFRDHNSQFGKLPAEEQSRLNRQAVAMAGYLEVLDERITNFKL